MIPSTWTEFCTVSGEATSDVRVANERFVAVQREVAPVRRVRAHNFPGKIAKHDGCMSRFFQPKIRQPVVEKIDRHVTLPQSRVLTKCRHALIHEAIMQCSLEGVEQVNDVLGFIAGLLQLIPIANGVFRIRRLLNGHLHRIAVQTRLVGNPILQGWRQ
jgi:hypothetical protein